MLYHQAARHGSTSFPMQQRRPGQ